MTLDQITVFTFYKSMRNSSNLTSSNMRLLYFIEDFQQNQLIQTYLDKPTSSSTTSFFVLLKKYSTFNPCMKPVKKASVKWTK